MIIQINITAVLVATAVNFIVGMIWYSPKVFGSLWNVEMRKKQPGFSPDMEKRMIPIFGGSILAAFVMALVLEQILIMANAGTFVGGALVALGLWFGFILTTQLNTVLYEKASKNLYFINTGYTAVALILMGGILAAWK